MINFKLLCCFQDNNIRDNSVETRTRTVYKQQKTGYKPVILLHPTRTSYEPYTYWDTLETFDPVESLPDGCRVESSQQEYRLATRNAVYYCFKESEFTEFGSAPIKPTESRLVEVRTLYRYSSGKNDSVTTSISNFPSSDDGDGFGFSDVRETDWFSPYVQKAVLLGAMLPDEYLYFYPKENINISDVVKAAVILYRTYNGESGALAGISAIDYAIEKGIIESDDFADYGKEATRAETVYVLWHVLPAEELSTINNYEYVKDLSTDSRYYKCVSRFAQAGIISWPEPTYDFHPDDTTTRAEVAAFICRLAYPELRVTNG